MNRFAFVWISEIYVDKNKNTQVHSELLMPTVVLLQQLIKKAEKMWLFRIKIAKFKIHP